MERYDSYKDCGIYYLPLMPSDWQILRAKYLFKQEQRPVKDSDEIITCFRDGQVTLRRNRRIDGFTNSLKEIGYQGVRRGDLVIHNMDAFAGAIGISDSDGKATPVYSCCTPLLESIDSYYYCFFLRYLAKSNFILSLAKGIRERSTDFRFSDFKKLYLPVPSYSEQQAIATYLDEETGKLDAAVEKLERMVEVLKERKQLIISKAVTRGLDDSIPLKDSGVEWIGQIPEHWNLFRLRYLCKIKTGDKDTVNRVENGIYPFFVRSPKVERINSYSFDGEAVLMAGDGVGAGKVFHHVNGKFGCHQRVYILHNFNKIIGLFLYYFMQNKFQHTIEQLSAKSTVDSVRLNMIQDFCVSLPSLTEQTAIAAYLDEKVGKLDEAIEKQLRMIELLKERKQILISDVVTGKIKVA